MKRIKLSFVAIAILAIAASAFTTRTVDEYAKIGSTYVLLDQLKKGQPVPGGWDCFPPVSPVCTYVLKPGAVAPYDQDDFEPSIINKTFNWIIPPTP